MNSTPQQRDDQAVVVRKIARVYPGQQKPAVSGVSFELGEGEILSLVGPSGCGKSTILRLIAGLEPLSEGSIHIGGLDATTLTPAARNVGWVPQNYGLFPHMSVASNVAYGLKVRGVSALERAAAVEDALGLVQLEDFARRKPSDLSGGQRQRVAIARAIASNPRVLLLDEPLAALDPQLREGLRAQLAKILRDSGRSAIIVTHDQREALSLGDKVAVLSAGRLVQCASPEEIWANPANDFVANFVSRGRMIAGTLDGNGGVRIADGAVLPFDTVDVRENAAAQDPGTQILVTIRPHDFTVADASAEPAFTVEVLESEYVGAAVGITARVGTEKLYLELPPGSPISGRLKLVPRPGAISAKRLPHSFQAAGTGSEHLTAQEETFESATV